MRLRVALELEREAAVPINHQHLLTGVVYRFLEAADADYAAFLHGEGYAVSPPLSPPSQGGVRNERSQGGAQEDRRRFKLFVFSPLRAKRRRADGVILRIGPGPVEWLVSSPVEKFLTEFATGLLSAGVLQVGTLTLPIAQVEALPEPEFGDTARFTCLSPIVVSVTETREGRRVTRYLRPDDPAFGERVRLNLLAKYAALYGALPSDDRLTLTFDAAYLARNRGTKKITYKEIEVVGAFAPFQISGSPELIRVGYTSGLGEKNAGGFGMVEVDRRGGEQL
jgi:CRISPR-associated endoribonuclease Cas6